jgi:hypothetical protein
MPAASQGPVCCVDGTAVLNTSQHGQQFWSLDLSNGFAADPQEYVTFQALANLLLMVLDPAR